VSQYVGPTSCTKTISDSCLWRVIARDLNDGNGGKAVVEESAFYGHLRPTQPFSDDRRASETDLEATDQLGCSGGERTFN
jgi:hypothetical protein